MAGMRNFIEDDSRDQDSVVELRQQRELTGAREVDERSGVRDDRHGWPGVRHSSRRSSTG